MNEPVRYNNSQYWICEDGSVYNEKTNNFKQPVKHFKYLRYCLHIDGKYLTKYLHRLLAECFIPNPFGFKEVRHLNDKQHDNRLENLAWGTREDNLSDAAKNGVFFGSKSRGGQRKLTISQANKIRKLHTKGASVRSLSKKFSVHRACVYSILKNKSYKS